MAISTGAAIAGGLGLLAGGAAKKSLKGLPGAKLSLAGRSQEQITTANLFNSLSKEQKKDLLLNNPNIEGPGGRQVYDPLTNTIRIEESEFQQGQRGRQESLARSLSEQLQGIELSDTDSEARFEQGRQLLEPAFTEQREQLEQSLADRGLPSGSEAYARELNRLESSQGRQLQQLSFESVQTAEAQRSARFNELASLLGNAQVGGVGFGQFQPQFSGLDLFGAEQGQLNRAFEAEQARKDRSATQRAALIKGLGSLGGAFIGSDLF
jgi:dsRNA-specific ribonuclease